MQLAEVVVLSYITPRPPAVHVPTLVHGNIAEREAVIKTISTPPLENGAKGLRVCERQFVSEVGPVSQDKSIQQYECMCV